MDIFSFIKPIRSVPTPDKEGCSYLYLFKTEYRRELYDKLGRYPKIKDVKEILRNEICG